MPIASAWVEARLPLVVSREVDLSEYTLLEHFMN